MQLTHLTNARNSKDDEFYTTYETVKKELDHYIENFKDKIIYCNADNPYSSNFVKYFIINFNRFKIKKLYISSYCKDKVNNFKCEISHVKKSYDLEELNNDEINKILQYKNNYIVKLNDFGSYDSKYLTDFVNDCDIIITNPPFSKYRDYFNFIISNNKNFIILSTILIACYKDIFKEIKNNNVNVGYRTENHTEFKRPDGTIKQINTSIFLYKLNHIKKIDELKNNIKYDKNKYDCYDGTNILNIPRVKLIPDDYIGKMGVPITFLLKYNKNQFNIIELNKKYTSNGKKLFNRIVISKKI